MAQPRFCVLPLAALGDGRLSARDLRVLGALYAYADRAGACWPGRSLLAAITGLPEQRISATTTRLARLGWLQKDGRGGRSSTCRYRLHPPGGRCQTVRKAVTVPDPVTVTASGETVTGSGGKTLTPVGDTHGTVQEQTRRTDQRRGRSLAVELPGWMPEALWREFLEHRRAIKAPMTDCAQRRALAEFGRLRERGYDPEAVVAQSIVNGWRGLFPPRAGRAESRFRASVAALEGLFQEAGDGEEGVSAGHGVSRRGLRG